MAFTVQFRMGSTFLVCSYGKVQDKIPVHQSLVVFKRNDSLSIAGLGNDFVGRAFNRSPGQQAGNRHRDGKGVFVRQIVFGRLVRLDAEQIASLLAAIDERSVRTTGLRVELPAGAAGGPRPLLGAGPPAVAAAMVYEVAELAPRLPNTIVCTITAVQRSSEMPSRSR